MECPPQHAFRFLKCTPKEWKKKYWMSATEKKQQTSFILKKALCSKKTT
jgi:hypothetical protein